MENEKGNTRPGSAQSKAGDFFLKSLKLTLHTFKRAGQPVNSGDDGFQLKIISHASSPHLYGQPLPPDQQSGK